MHIKIKATLLAKLKRESFIRNNKKFHPGFTPTPLRIWGFTLIEVIIVTAVIALLAAIAIPGLLRARMAANETLAKGTLRSISNAVEMYMATNSVYPSSEADLIAPNASPPYLFRAYDNQTIKGYIYNYDFTSGYAVNATPQTCGRSGTQVFSLSSGVINETACE